MLSIARKCGNQRDCGCTASNYYNAFVLINKIVWPMLWVHYLAAIFLLTLKYGPVSLLVIIITRTTK